MFGGGRWLAPGEARNVVPLGAGAAVATAGGLTLLRSEAWTLARKAEHFEALAARYFDRHGAPAVRVLWQVGIF